ncbi:MAG: hypothetical protein ACTHKM_04105 [Tsuneonella sp.]
MATLARPAAASRTFYRRMAIGLSLFIVFGFAQFALRGMVDIARVPTVVHLHALAMVSWLALFSVQAGLPTRGALALHRKLGLISLALVPLIVVLAIMTVVTMLRLGGVPPFFTPGYFFALVVVESMAFAAMVAWALAARGRTDWHRRLMLGAAVIILEPALGRILPMPLLGATAHWVELGLQLVVIALIALHDRKQGALHPATIASGVAVIFTHLLIATLAVTPAWQALTERVAA